MTELDRYAADCAVHSAQKVKVQSGVSGLREFTQYRNIGYCVYGLFSLSTLYGTTLYSIYSVFVVGAASAVNMSTEAASRCLLAVNAAAAA